MGNCVCSSSNISGLNESERAISTLVSTSRSRHIFPFANHLGRPSLVALNEVEQEWIYTLAEFANMPDSVKHLGLILEREFSLILHGQHRTNTEYETLARAILQEALAIVHNHSSLHTAEEEEATTTAPPPASQRAIQMLPKTTWKSNNNSFDNLCRKCNVCHDDYADDEYVKTLPCGHFFHESCIESWLKRHCTCPLCRCHLPTDDVLYNYMKSLLSEGSNDESETDVQHDDSLGDGVAEYHY